MGRDEESAIKMAVSLNVIHWQQESNAQDKSSSSLKLMLLAETKQISSIPVFFMKKNTGFSGFFQSNED